jgi:hypothetical protein
MAAEIAGTAVQRRSEEALTHAPVPAGPRRNRTLVAFLIGVAVGVLAALAVRGV